MSDNARFPQVARLLSIMERLRDPQTGCPWDIKQSFSSIAPYTIEEAYEVADAIERGDMDDIRDELGDLLFQVVFYAQMGKEDDAFDFEAIAQTVADKLIRRHPHVFEDSQINDEHELDAQWQRIKLQERQHAGKDQDKSILANHPTGLEPLTKAHKIQKACAKVGFDWQHLAPVLAKVREELIEIEQEIERQPQQQAAIEEEVGDLLFAVVNLSRHLKVEPGTALRRANQKFEQRFRGVEQQIVDSGLSLDEATLEQMEACWQQVKNQSMQAK